MSAMDALHAKVRMKQYFSTDLGAGLTLAMSEVAFLRLPPDQCDHHWSYEWTGADFTHDDPDADLQAGQKTRDRLLRHIEIATPYWVSEEMAHLTMHAASSRESGVVSIEDFPVQHGFVFFDKPLVLELLDPDGGTETLSIKVFTWQIGTNLLGQPGMALTYWSQTGQRADKLGENLLSTGQRPFNDAGPYIVAQQGFLPFGTEQERPTWWAQFAATFAALIDQEIPVISEERVDKKMNRLVRRANINANTVLIVTLRHKKANPESTGTGTSPGVRVLVGATTGGFWTTVWHGPGKTLKKKVWVMPFWRGPEDAPIVWRTDIIYRWSR